MTQFAERRASDGKVVDSQFDSRTGNASLRLWLRHFTLTGAVEAKNASSLLVVVAKSDKRHAYKI